MNLSRWYEYSDEQKQQILSEMASLVRNRQMPLPRYLLLHPSAKLSDAEVDQPYQWARKERKRLKLMEVPPGDSSPSVGVSRRAILKAVLVASSIGVAFCSAATPNEAVCSRLYSAFVAPCCWHESVGIHQSLEADQMRREIAELVREGKTEPEIRALYIARYGERILVEPEGLKRLVLNLIPWTVLVLGFVYLVKFVRRGIALQQSED